MSPPISSSRRMPLTSRPTTRCGAIRRKQRQRPAVAAAGGPLTRRGQTPPPGLQCGFKVASMQSRACDNATSLFIARFCAAASVRSGRVSSFHPVVVSPSLPDFCPFHLSANNILLISLLCRLSPPLICSVLLLGICTPLHFCAVSSVDSKTQRLLLSTSVSNLAYPTASMPSAAISVSVRLAIEGPGDKLKCSCPLPQHLMKTAWPHQQP